MATIFPTTYSIPTNAHASVVDLSGRYWYDEEYELTKSAILSCGYSEFPDNIEDMGTIPEGKEVYVCTTDDQGRIVESIPSEHMVYNISCTEFGHGVKDPHELIKMLIRQFRELHYHEHKVYWKTMPEMRRNKEGYYTIFTDLVLVHKDCEVLIK